MSIDGRRKSEKKKGKERKTGTNPHSSSTCLATPREEIEGERKVGPENFNVCLALR